MNEAPFESREYRPGDDVPRGSRKAGGGAPLILPPPSAPVLVARCFVKSRCLHNGTVGALTVRYWCGSWWIWRTTHWLEAQPRTLRSLLYEFTADAVYLDPVIPGTLVRVYVRDYTMNRHEKIVSGTWSTAAEPGI